MRATDLIHEAICLARSNYGEREKRWTKWSYRIGGTDVGLVSSAQDCQNFEMLLCQLEDEHSDVLSDGNSQNPSMVDSMVEKQALIFKYSNLWLSGVYEVFRIYRNKALPSEHLSEIYKYLKIVRIAVHKMEIANIRRRQDELVEFCVPTADSQNWWKRCRYGDPYFAPRGISERGSVMWHCVDATKDEVLWIERRTLADVLLNYLVPKHG